MLWDGDASLPGQCTYSAYNYSGFLLFLIVSFMETTYGLYSTQAIFSIAIYIYIASGNDLYDTSEAYIPVQDWINSHSPESNFVSTSISDNFR